MSVLLFLAAAIALRSDAPQLTLAQAKAMTPAELSDALLAPGHPLIVDARVGLQGMVPPPPPGQPFQSPIELTVAGSDSSQSGFCERTIVKILLAPVIYVGHEAPAAAPVKLDTTQTYSWMYNSGERAGCRAPHKQYFSIEQDERRTFDLIRSLAAIQARARSGKHIDVVASIDDLEARQWREWAKTNDYFRGRVRAGKLPEITSAKAALAQFPLGDISYVAEGQRSWRNLLSETDLVATNGKKREVVTLFAGGSWSAEMALEHGTIKVIRISREIPPPF
ncbi:hypothetical protein ACT009_09990 [Sphingomonas sp. Tas61C01]|uniref:hypothetical protein n=1 Tax=Sphingomonas sp. Tas61C01 TaxID=3458297 RepID=UPI00403EEE61